MIDIPALRDYLIGRKTKALEHERHAVGTVRAVMTAQIQWIDALLIYLSSNGGKEDMDKLNLRLEEAVPLDEFKKKQKLNSQLTKQIVEFAEQVKLNNIRKIAGVTGKQASTLASKIYALRDNGTLPELILPATEKNDDGVLEVYIAHVTPEELEARIAAGKLKRRAARAVSV